VAEPELRARMVIARTLAGALCVVAVLFAKTACGRSAPVRPGPPPRVFAFLSDSGGSELDHLRRFGSRISVIAPNWYELNASKAVLSGGPNASVVALAHAAVAQLWPVVNDRLGSGTAIGDSRIRSRIATVIADEAAARGYDGITLDIEQLPADQTAAYTALVAIVARRLHAQHEHLAVYVPRRTLAGGDTDYDWPALDRCADLLIASGYDEHTATSAPGPVMSTSGFARMLDYAARISRFSVAPAIAAFGYSWPAGGGAGQMISSVDAERWRVQTGAAARAVDGDAMLRGNGRIVFYQDAPTLDALAREARAHGMRWLALFSLGREPDSFWADIQTARQRAPHR
jgi:spore germination protein YaaH